MYAIRSYYARDFAAAVLPRSALSLADVYLEQMRQRGVFDLAQGRVVPVGSDSHMTAAGELAEALYDTVISSFQYRNNFV